MLEDKSAREKEEFIRAAAESVSETLQFGGGEEEAVQDLMKQGWPEANARNLVGMVKRSIEKLEVTPEGQKKLANTYARHMLYGILWAVGGTVVTVLTYAAAIGGGTYIIAWGAIAFGIFDFFRGLIGYLKYK